MHIRGVFVFWCDRHRWTDRRLGNLLNFHRPFILRLLQIVQPVLWLSVGNNNIDTCFFKDPVYLWYHFVRVDSWVFAALYMSWYFTRTESNAALSRMASKLFSLNSIARASIWRYFKESDFYLYFSVIDLTTKPHISILVISV